MKTNLVSYYNNIDLASVDSPLVLSAAIAFLRSSSIPSSSSRQSGFAILITPESD